MRMGLSTGWCVVASDLTTRGQSGMLGPCASKTDIRQELHDFCASIDQQHRDRVERMKGWLKDWYGAEYPRTDDIPLWLGSLQEQQFEREFLKEYTGHHADAIDPMAECAKKATHPELRELCQRVAPPQKAQLQQMKQWACVWFKDCDWSSALHHRSDDRPRDCNKDQNHARKNQGCR